ncbi:MAG: glycosyltransferase [Chthoniobacterales bacterium]|nr:glycosyltransferase [Chthoniobacterales bacterium]
MKVCDLTQFYSPVSGGVKRYLEQKVIYMRQNRPGDEHILIIPGERTEVKRDKNSRVYTIRSPLVSRTSRYRILLDLTRVEEIFELERPSIIESGDPYQMAWKAVISGRSLGIPVVGFYHSHFAEAYLRSVAKYFGQIALHITEEISRRYVRNLYNHFEKTIVPSPALASLLEEWGVENATNIDLGVDTNIFYPGDRSKASERIRKEFGISSQATVLLYVGRLAPEKNVRTLIKAFETLEERSPGKFHLLTVGDGMLRSALKRLQENKQNVSWKSYCSDAHELAEIYRAADLFVHPSINETFGLVALESQACGTPVVGIKGSYMDRIIFSGQKGWAEENSPDALARAILNMVNSGQLALNGEKAAETVRAHYSWNGVFKKLFKIYEEVIRNYGL